MTLRLNLDEIRARVEGRREQKIAREAALRERGVTTIESKHITRPSNRNLLARVLPWRRRED
jgi:hypothetical protein